MLNFSRTAGEQQTVAVEAIRTSDLPEGDNLFVLLCGDISTNLPDALGNMPKNYRGDDLTMVSVATYFNASVDAAKFVQWVYTGLEPSDDGSTTHADPMWDLGMDNAKPQGKQSFGNKSPQTDLYVPVLTGVTRRTDDDGVEGFVLANTAVRVLRISGNFQISNMLTALQSIKQRRVLGKDGQGVMETSGIGRILVIRKSKNKARTEYGFSMDEAPAINIGEFKTLGVQAANKFVSDEISRIDFWATDQVKELSNTNPQLAARLAVNNIRAHFMSRAGMEFQDASEVGLDTWLDNIDKAWPSVATKYHIGADKPVVLGEPTKILSGHSTDQQEGDPF